jgi:hypothetical protein
LSTVVRQINKLKFDSLRKLFSITVTTILLIGLTVIPVRASALDSGKYNCNTGVLDNTLDYGYFTIASDVVKESNSCTGAVIIPSGVSRIDNSGFLSQTTLTSVTIPDSVESIGTYAFFENYMLTSVIIPNSVISIGANAFNVHVLTSITFLGNAPLTVGVNAFSGVANKAIANVTNEATGFDSGGIFWNGLRVFRPGEPCYTVTGVVLTDGSYCRGDFIIPSGVTSIDGEAFSDNYALTSVTIPDSVTSIGAGAFYNNTALTSVIIGNSVTSIGVGAFQDNISLEFVTIGNSVRTIGNNAFSDDIALRSVAIPDSVLTIGNDAFLNNSALTSVTIGNSVTSIGNSAFRGNTVLRSVTIPDSVTSIGAGAFVFSPLLASVTFLGIAALTDDVIGDVAFSGLAAGAIANVAYNATGFPPDGDDWKGLIVRYASAPIGDSGSSSSNVVTITPAVVKTADASFKLTNRKYLSKFEIRKAITKGRSFKRKPIDFYKYSISKTSKKYCVMSGNYVMALKETGACDLYVTRTTAKGAKYKYWVKINYSK